MGDRNELPEYYYENNWLEDKIAQIQEATRILQGVSFVFITDIHVPSNSMNSKYLIREVLKRTTVEDVFFGEMRFTPLEQRKSAWNRQRQ